MRTRLTLLLICLCLAGGLSACGQKGPLVLPPAEDQTE